MFYKLTIFNLAGFALLFVGYINGLLQKVYEADQSKISLAIFGLFLVGLYYAFKAAYKRTDRPYIKTAGPNLTSLNFIAGACVTLGLIGTVLGFIYAFSGIENSDSISINNLSQLVSEFIVGVGIAFYTTLVGAVLGLWLLTNQWLLVKWSEESGQQPR